MTRTLCSLASVFFLMLAPAVAQIVFETPIDAGGGTLGLRTHLADLDGDDKLDVLIDHFVPFSGLVTLSIGDGEGGFGAPLAILPVGSRLGPLADFDADGHLDLVAFSNDRAPNSATVRLGLGDGSFGPPVAINGNYQNPVDAGIADFDGDGALDIILANREFGFEDGAILGVFGNGDGSFQPPVTLVPSSAIPSGSHLAMDVGDVDGDGLIDFVYDDQALVRVMRSNGDGSFTLVDCGHNCKNLVDDGFFLVDLNDDGRADMVMDIEVRLGQADGTFVQSQVLPFIGGPLGMAAGDFDGDGVLDLVQGLNQYDEPFNPLNTIGSVRVMRGRGDGTFYTPGLIVSHVPQPQGLTVGDLNGDGKPDVAAATKFGASALRVLLNHTYGPGSPFLDLGGALAGDNGFPIQTAEGTLLTGQPFSFRLTSGPLAGAAFHVVGFAAINAPFKGGTMIPAVNLVNGPFPLDGTGQLNLAGNWPAGGSGLTLWVQYWMPNGGGPKGLVASSGVRAQIP